MMMMMTRSRSIFNCSVKFKIHGLVRSSCGLSKFLIAHSLQRSMKISSNYSLSNLFQTVYLLNDGATIGQHKRNCIVQLANHKQNLVGNLVLGMTLNSSVVSWV